MHCSVRRLALASGVIVLMASRALAGQFAEFEAQLRAAYAPYRDALFQTNKDKAASERALKKFSSDWTALAARWGKEPPPQYLDDARFVSTLAEVTSVAENAHAAISKGDLADAHEILGGIRELLGDLRSRNGRPHERLSRSDGAHPDETLREIRHERAGRAA